MLKEVIVHADEEDIVVTEAAAAMLRVVAVVEEDIREAKAANTLKMSTEVPNKLTYLAVADAVVIAAAAVVAVDIVADTLRARKSELKVATKEVPVVTTKVPGVETSVVHAVDDPFLAVVDDPVEPLNTEKKAPRMLRTAMGANRIGRLKGTFRQQGRGCVFLSGSCVVAIFVCLGRSLGGINYYSTRVSHQHTLSHLSTLGVIFMLSFWWLLRRFFWAEVDSVSPFYLINWLKLVVHV